VSPILESIGSVKGFGWGAFNVPNSFESIATATGTGSSGVINFTSIPSTFKHLQIRISALPTAAETIACRVGNGSIDTASNYTRHSLNGNGTDAAAYGVANFAYWNIYGLRITSDTTNPIVAIVDILDYADTNKFKTFRALSGTDKNGGGEIALNSGLWRSTSAIDQIRVFAEGAGNWATSSTFALYGIKGA
jgi:hypothetical protein